MIPMHLFREHLDHTLFLPLEETLHIQQHLDLAEFSLIYLEQTEMNIKGHLQDLFKMIEYTQGGKNE